MTGDFLFNVKLKKKYISLHLPEKLKNNNKVDIEFKF